MVEFSALLACTLLAGLAVFQLLLVFGAPLGNYAWGGNHRILTKKLRVGSLISVILYGFFAIIILTKAGLITLVGNTKLADTWIWVLAGYFFVGVLMNGMSRSKSERIIMTPVALALAVLFLIVARG